MRLGTDVFPQPAQAVEILAGLERETVAWGPLAWHALSKHRIGDVGDGTYPAVLANFPTMTEISRSAFFAGKPMTVGKAHKSGEIGPKSYAHLRASLFDALARIETMLEKARADEREAKKRSRAGARAAGAA